MGLWTSKLNTRYWYLELLVGNDFLSLAKFIQLAFDFKKNIHSLTMHPSTSSTSNFKVLQHTCAIDIDEIVVVHCCRLFPPRKRSWKVEALKYWSSVLICRQVFTVFHQISSTPNDRDLCEYWFNRRSSWFQRARSSSTLRRPTISTVSSLTSRLWTSVCPGNRSQHSFLHLILGTW